jgi:hypothetical protein
LTIENLPAELQQHLNERQGAAVLERELPKAFAAQTVARFGPEHRAWEQVGIHFLGQNRPSEALAIFAGLYDHLLSAQELDARRYHKGTPLVWMSDCYAAMGCTATAHRYLMLTLVEDGVQGRGKISPVETGVYHRLVWRGWLSDPQLQKYSEDIYKLYDHKNKSSFFPEWILQQLDTDWITQLPTPHESGLFATNRWFISHLMASLPDPSGKTLENLAAYLLSCIPGCRISLRQRTRSSDHDLVCAVEGSEVDFRSEFGRYFVCECKDWAKPADFTTMAKFCRVLDSVKSRFGILFSSRGITGGARTTDATNEQLKVFMIGES